MLEVLNPATGETLCRVQQAGPEDVERLHANIAMLRALGVETEAVTPEELQKIKNFVALRLPDLADGAQCAAFLAIVEIGHCAIPLRCAP